MLVVGLVGLAAAPLLAAQTLTGTVDFAFTNVPASDSFVLKSVDCSAVTIFAKSSAAMTTSKATGSGTSCVYQMKVPTSKLSVHAEINVAPSSSAGPWPVTVVNKKASSTSKDFCDYVAGCSAGSAKAVMMTGDAQTVAAGASSLPTLSVDLTTLP